MQRPTRILVFGILCLVMGLLSGLDNLGALRASIVGPGATQTPAGTEMPEFLRDANKAIEAALSKPIYRVLWGAESALGAVMAGLLIAGGIGLLQDRAWGVRLAKLWAYFAIGSAAFTIFLQAKFVIPEYPAAISGSAMPVLACMLPVLWVFPVLLLTLSTRPVVTNYLSARANQPRLYRTSPMPHDPTMPQQLAPPTQPAARAPSAPRVDEDAPPLNETWRDDPWND